MYSTQFVRPQGYAQRVLEKNTECKEKLCFQENSTDTFKAGNSVVCLKLFFSHMNIWNKAGLLFPFKSSQVEVIQVNFIYIAQNYNFASKGFTNYP